MIAVIIVTYNSSDVIRNCLESLILSEGEVVRVVVVDNASTDATIQTIRDWAADRAINFQDISVRASGPPKAQCTLMRSDVNLGFAGAVNLGLEAQLADRDCDL